MDKIILETKGIIFNIQRYSIHDGPGIRTNVFLKGCPLRCKWCCNPESQNPQIENMLDPEGNPATMGREVTVAEVLEEVIKDARYYYRSGGGVTLTGGECMVQPTFACDLLKACREREINTAIETTAFATSETVKKFLPLVDYWMMDIKHMDPEQHKLFTGQPNDLILQNAKYIAQNHPHLTIRVPVVPGVNDTEEQIDAICAFADTLGPGAKAVHLLPYHRLGEDKYQRLGRPYFLQGTEPLSPERMNELLSVARKHRLPAQIGG